MIERSEGICSTDLHAYEGTQPYFSYPRILGHEIAGGSVHYCYSIRQKTGILFIFGRHHRQGGEFRTG
nr:alcohol dehydrogenase catalytic domain-containing protein [Algoriphagus sp. 4150]